MGPSWLSAASSSVSDDAQAGILLDTCALIWVAQGQGFRNGSEPRLRQAAREGRLIASVVSAWEIGMLSRMGNHEAGFTPDPATWFSTLIAAPGLRLAPFTADIAIAASRLPEPLHRDPADRLIIATARACNLSLATRDGKIIAYAALGYLDVLPC